MSKITKWKDRTLYGTYEDPWNDKRFRQYLLKIIRPNSVVHDYGAGSGTVEEMDLKGIARHMGGVDPDEAVSDLKKVECWEGRPEYLRFTASTYALGSLQERIVNSTGALAQFHCVLIFAPQEIDRPDTASAVKV